MTKQWESNIRKEHLDDGDTHILWPGKVGVEGSRLLSCSLFKLWKGAGLTSLLGFLQKLIQACMPPINSFRFPMVPWYPQLLELSQSILHRS